MSGYVAKGNEHMATPEVREKVAKLAEMFQQMRDMQENIRNYCEVNGLYHLDYEYEINLNEDPLYAHECWLASNHNC